MMNLHSFNLKKLTGIVLIALLSGCASSSDNPIAHGGIIVDRVDSRDAKIAHVYVRTDGSKTRVSGNIRRTLQRRGHIPGHLHIEVFGGNGELLIQKTTGYHRRNLNSRPSYFSESMPIQPSKVSKVRVTHHGLADNHS